MQLRMPRGGLVALTLAAAIGVATVGPAHGSSEPTAARAATATPLLRAHAHNDYLNQPTVTGALGHGFTSLEADVWLKGIGQKLMLCHDFSGTVCLDDLNHETPPQEFDTTYLAGLRTWVNNNGGRIYPGYDRPIYLLVEIKCQEAKDDSGTKWCSDDGSHPGTGAGAPNNPLNVLDELKSELQPYRQMLYSLTNQTGPVQLIITGGHNGQPYNDPQGNGTTSVRDVLHQTNDPWYGSIYLDGTLDGDYDANDELIPLVSFSYEKQPNCDIQPGALLNPGSPPRMTTTRVDEILNAHVHHRQVRVYDLPDCPARGDSDDPAYKLAREKAWDDAKFAGVDYISSNHLQYLQDWLLAHYNDPAQGGGACGDRQLIPPGVHHSLLLAQYCTVWTANVPVYPDKSVNSKPVGYLLNGGRANWFLGQTQGTEFQYPGQTWRNDWWAYTEADNGTWGWTPVVYFSGGGNDQPADALISCLDVRTGTTPCQPWPL